MTTVSKEYLLLFNTVTQTIERLEVLRDDLIFCQQQAEELYITRDPNIMGQDVYEPPESSTEPTSFHRQTYSVI